ncbi:polyadenylate-binding protein 1A-like [Engraulis encrasicolus]|uniref:polyadenylate-binding protein 1A-like n=1 Tax=Engraulis encrasicolus TaxID=184585 RepID=UPI002FD4C173
MAHYRARTGDPFQDMVIEKRVFAERGHLFKPRKEPRTPSNYTPRPRYEEVNLVGNLNGRILGTKPLYVAPAQHTEQRQQAYPSKQRAESKLVNVSHVQNELDLQPQTERQTELQRMLQRMQQNMPRHRGFNLFIKNIPKTMGEEHLRKEFAPYGTITRAKVIMEGGRSKGFGFVCFSSPEEATKAMADMNGRILGTKPLYVAPAQHKDQRQAYLRKQWVESKRAAPSPVDLGAEFGGCAKPLTNDVKNVGVNLDAEKLREIFGLRAVPNPVIKHHQQPSAPSQYSAVASPQAQNHAAYYQPSQQVQLHPGAHLAIQDVHPLLFQGMPGAMSPSGYNLETPIYYVIPAGAQVPSMVDSQYVMSQAVDAHLASASASAHVQGQEVLTASVLAALPLEMQKHKLGMQLHPLIENMVPKVQTIHPRLPDKVTGMLLEIDNSELLQMLESAELLRSKVDEAVGVLQLHQAKEADQDGAASTPVRGA